MKSIIGAFVLALFIVCLALPNLVFAGAEGSSATGSLKFVLDDGATRFVEFNAKEGTDGQATGEMTFSDPVAIPVDNPDDGETPKTEGVILKAKFDCMTTFENRAVIGEGELDCLALAEERAGRGHEQLGPHRVGRGHQVV